MSTEMEAGRERLLVEVVSGVEGPCLVIENFRVAGPKPWGGGRVYGQWRIDRADLLTRLLSEEERAALAALATPTPERMDADPLRS